MAKRRTAQAQKKAKKTPGNAPQSKYAKKEAAKRAEAAKDRIVSSTKKKGVVLEKREA